MNCCLSPKGICRKATSRLKSDPSLFDHWHRNASPKQPELRERTEAGRPSAFQWQGSPGACAAGPSPRSRACSSTASCCPCRRRYDVWPHGFNGVWHGSRYWHGHCEPCCGCCDGPSPDGGGPSSRGCSGSHEPAAVPISAGSAGPVHEVFQRRILLPVLHGRAEGLPAEPVRGLHGVEGPEHPWVCDTCESKEHPVLPQSAMGLNDGHRIITKAIWFEVPILLSFCPGSDQLNSIQVRQFRSISEVVDSAAGILRWLPVAPPGLLVCLRCGRLDCGCGDRNGGHGLGFHGLRVPAKRPP